ncbi:MAG: DNA polymerase/3'-5' exonuclease PolX [Dehalococcoidia bacterium]
MKNSEVAGIFNDIAGLLELKGENQFKIRAYKRAAHTIEQLPNELETIVKEDIDLRSIPGIGEAIAKKTVELITTGRLEYFENLKAEFPEGIFTLLEIPGIGPRTAKRLNDMGIGSVDSLEHALREKQLDGIPGMGDKTSENILRQIENLRRKDRRIPAGHAMQVVEEVFDMLRASTDVRNLTAAGSLRRFKETVGDIDLMGTADAPESVIATFVSLPNVKEVLMKGPTKASVILEGELQADLRMVEHEYFGSLLQYFTGSKEHNVLLRQRGQKRGLKLSEYGITDISTGILEKFTDEESFYRRLGLQYIPPEIREGGDEIEIAARNEIPELVGLPDIKGDLHVHTEWSDGHDSIETMALAARDLGYSYVAITDHSGGRAIANGLSPERLKEQIREIKRVDEKLDGIRVLSGIEVDIKADGSLDMPDGLLAELDVVVAAVHSGMTQKEEKMTARIIKAIDNPLVDIIAHPTCRLIGERAPVDVDIEAVFKAAVKNNKALEINAMPSRLDLKDVHVKRARELGVMLTLGTDAHSSAQLSLMRFGVSVARRGWCRVEHIVNTRSVEELPAFIGRG